ncbi:hypothetical protein [Comamonas sp. JC664]|uniref:hypothetical protein n=1 Tax=Comamonas sp. JC664 TaxID=2801917 RepID=UPI0036153CB6
MINNGIADDYDSFCFEVNVGECYIDKGLIIKKNGVDIGNVAVDINNAILYRLVCELRENAIQRGNAGVLLRVV